MKKITTKEPKKVDIIVKVKKIIVGLGDGVWFSAVDIFNAQDEFDFLDVASSLIQLNDSGFIIRSSKSKDLFKLTKL